MYRCEGDADPGCMRWQAQAGETYEEKSRACQQCPKNCMPPLRDEDAAASREAELLVQQVSYLVAWENAGQDTDWNEYPFEIRKLFVVWREFERQVKNLRDARH